MQVVGDHVGITHSHPDRTVAEDRLKGWDISRGLKEPAGEGVAKIVAFERSIGATSDHGKDIGEG